MKRKVALGGRPGREFSWSMSVEPGEWYLPKHLKNGANVRRAAANLARTPGFCPSQMLMAGQTPCFFG